LQAIKAFEWRYNVTVLKLSIRMGWPSSRSTSEETVESTDGKGGGRRRDGLNVLDNYIYIYIINRLLDLIICFFWKHGKYYTRFKLHMAPTIKTNKMS
jgi:hypothetical protein